MGDIRVDDALEFERFNEKLLDSASLRYPNMDVNIREVIKNNDTLLHGFTMHPKDGSFFISPCVYTEPFFERTKIGTPENEVFEAVFTLMDAHMTSGNKLDFSPENLLDSEFVSSHVVMKLVNSDRNAERLKDVPHREVYDLSVEYRILVNYDNEMQGAISVTNAIMEGCGLNEIALHTCALENTKKLLGVSVMSLGDKMRSLGVEENPFSNPPFYIISNDSYCFGAASVLYDEALQSCSEKLNNQDLVVLPSSVHEIICIPANTLESSELLEMVRSVNANTVAPDEQLSDNFYMYDAKKHLFSDLQTYEKNHSEESSEQEDEENTRTQQNQEEETEDESFARPRHR